MQIVRLEINLDALKRAGAIGTEDVKDLLNIMVNTYERLSGEVPDIISIPLGYRVKAAQVGNATELIYNDRGALCVCRRYKNGY